MTQEEIIRMAQEAGLTFVTEFGVASAPPEWIERFAALIAAAERERCARVCDVYAANDPENFADICAAAIRARSQP